MDLTQIRPNKDTYYLNIAKEISKRSPCLKMKVGAILVKDDAIISTGYNGPPRGESHCEVCYRLSTESGSEYKVCPAVHAEENCIINAARTGNKTIGSKLYLWTETGNKKPCYRCKRALLNAGIVEIIINKVDSGI